MTTRRSKTLPLVALAVSFTAAACGEEFFFEWAPNPGTATLFSLDREEFQRPAGFHMTERRPVVIESAESNGEWDFAVDRQDGALVLLPPQALGVPTRAGIAVLEGVAFDDARIAPGDTLAYSTLEPVPLAEGNVYVIRTHQQPNFFGQNCFYFGKLEPIEIDPVAGVFRFTHDTNPDCNSRRLVPRD